MGDVIKFPPRYGGIPCGVQQALNAMDKTDRAIFKSLLTGTTSVAEVTALLEEAGHILGPATIWKHRRQQCMTCKREAA